MPESRISIAITDTGVWVARLHRPDARWSLAASAHRPAAVPATLRPETDLSALAHATIAACHDLGIHEGLARLTVPATWVLAYPLRLPAGRCQHQAAAFEFENFLPVALEALTCIFVPTASAEQYVGLAVPTSPLKALLAQLAQANLQVDSLIPDFTDPPELSNTPATTCLWCDEAHATVSAWSHGQPTALRAFRLNGAPAERLARAVASGSPGSPPSQLTILGGRVDEGLGRVLGEHLGGEVRLHGAWPAESPPETLLLPTPSDEFLNLRVDELAYSGRYQPTRKHALRCAVGVSILLLVLALTSWLQRRQYDRAIAGLQAQEQQVYAGVFPRQAVPPGATLRLASERRRLEGLTRSNVGPSSESQPDLLAQLREIIAAVPEKTRVNLQELRLDRRELILRGFTTAHRDAEQIAAGLRRVAGLEPHPPRSDVVKEGGVSFSLRADKSDKPPEAQPKPPTSPARLADAAHTPERKATP